MKFLSCICSVFVLLSFSAFTLPGNSGIAGKYGIPGDKTAITELALNTDHTFRFRDDLGEGNTVDVQGTWEVKNNFVLLRSNAPGKAFRNKWKITGNGMAAKSRKGLSFYRLARL